MQHEIKKDAGGAAARAAIRVCDACGYDLRGVQHTQCPECGAAISERSGELLLVTAEPAMLRRMRVGAILFVLTPWADGLAGEIVAGHEMLESVVPTAVFFGGLVVGVWLLTPSMSASPLGRSLRRPRLMFRVSVAFAWLLNVISAFVYSDSSSVRLDPTMRLVSAAVFMLPYVLMSVAFLYYARCLARRSQQPGFARAYSTALVIAAAAWCVSVVYYALLVGMLLGSEWSRAMWERLSQPVERVLSGAGWAIPSIVFWIMSIVLWVGLTRVIRRADALCRVSGSAVRADSTSVSNAT